MKKIIGVIAVIMALALCGCGDKGNYSSEDNLPPDGSVSESVDSSLEDSESSSDGGDSDSNDSSSEDDEDEDYIYPGPY